MATLFEQVEQFFADSNWAVSPLEGRTILQMGFQGDRGQWTCYAQVLEARQQFVFYSTYPEKVPAARRQHVAELLTRANFGLAIGNFELDFADGEVRYKTGIDVSGDRLSDGLIVQMMDANLSAMDRYLPAIAAVLEDATISPEQAIAMVEK